MNEVCTRAFIYEKKDIEKLIVNDLISRGKIEKADLRSARIDFDVNTIGKGFNGSNVTIEKNFNAKGIEQIDPVVKGLVFDDDESTSDMDFEVIDV